MYVGITRAKERLYLTYARKRRSFAQGGFSNYTLPSCFLSEISPEQVMGLESVSVFTETETDNDYNRFGSGSGGEKGKFGAGSGDRGAYQENNNSSWAARKAESRPAPGASAPPAAKPRVLSRSGPVKDEPAAQAGSRRSGVSPQADFARLSLQDKVMHSKFGMGVVVEVIGDGDKELYAVKFADAGKRLLDPRFARLVKLD